MTYIDTKSRPSMDDATTGEKCAIGQEGSVWFLNYPPGTRELTCTIPAGKAVLFPILSGECDYGVEDTDAKVSICATEVRSMESYLLSSPNIVPVFLAANF
jgi:hypothetical protein